MASMHNMGHGGMSHMGGAGNHGDGSASLGGSGPGGGYGQQQQQGSIGGGAGQGPGNPGGGGMPPYQQQGPPPQQQQQQQQQAPSKELNAAMLCRFGQETVQEIAGRSVEMFQMLKTTQPPDGKINLGMDRKIKFQELLKNIRGNFKRLRVIYEKIEETFPSNREMNFEEDIINKSAEETLPVDDKRNTEVYKQAVEEYKEVIEHVMLKNRQLKEAIDHLRTMIWDVNTMLAMRKE